MEISQRVARSVRRPGEASVNVDPREVLGRTRKYRLLRPGHGALRGQYAVRGDGRAATTPSFSTAAPACGRSAARCSRPARSWMPTCFCRIAISTTFSALPFFTPLFSTGHKLRIWAGNLSAEVQPRADAAHHDVAAAVSGRGREFQGLARVSRLRTRQDVSSRMTGSSSTPRCSIIPAVRSAIGWNTAASRSPTSPTTKCSPERSTPI